MDAVRVKVQIRLASQRVGQLQAKKDSQGQITRGDIVTLLREGNVSLARAKAQKLIREDALGDVLEILGMHLGVVLEHFSELEPGTSPSPSMVEATSTVIYAAPHVDCKELLVVRDILANQLGSDFIRSAASNRDNYVSPKVAEALNIPLSSIASLDNYLAALAYSAGVKWTPDLLPEQRVDALSELLDPYSPVPVVDMPRLRSLCIHGIPDHPPWLRPRIWRLLLGTIPVLRTSWAAEAKKHRDNYYDLVGRLLEPFSALPAPQQPLAPLDDGLFKVYRELNRVPRSLFLALEALEADSEPSHSSSAESSTMELRRLSCSDNLNKRLRLIQQTENDDTIEQSTPEIRLESDGDPESASALGTAQQAASTTLIPSQAFNAAPAPERHSSALLRLLYIHTRLNPANRSPHVASLLLPVYTAFACEFDTEELAHIEADTFWAFEAMVGEFSELVSELEDEESGGSWMHRLGERLAWADEDLSTNLRAKGLDPALPHYSYRWLAPVLTHTLPLPAVFTVWDALFSRPSATKSLNPKLDYLLDICTAMLIRAKAPLARLGKPSYKSSGLWTEDDTLPPPSPLRPWELSDAFMEGMSFLQMYPVDAVGGVDNILATALELLRRREQQMKLAAAANTTSLGARLRDTMWRGFTNQVADLSIEEDIIEEEEEEEEEEEDDDEGNETETDKTQKGSSLTSRLASTVWQGFTNQSFSVAASSRSPGSPLLRPASHLSTTSPTGQPSGMTSRVATTVWRGITNQSSMDVPASPLPPSSPTSPRSQSPLPNIQHMTNTLSPSVTRSSIWGYAEKLKDSDTAATLAKVSTNWTARALSAWNRTGSSGISSTPASPAALSSRWWESSDDDRRDSYGSTLSEQIGGSSNRGSIFRPGHSNTYSPPPRPAFFRPPRDSMLPQPRMELTGNASNNEDGSMQSESGVLDRTKHLQSSLAALTGLQQPVQKATPRSGPRPLLLSSSSLMTGSNRASKVGSVSSHNKQWSEVMQAKGHPMRSASQSSSSTTLSIARAGDRLEWDSDAGRSRSRVIPLNRARSPMAPNFRFARERPDSTSSATSSENGTSGPPSISGVTPRKQTDSSSERGWGRVDRPDSPITLPSSPPPRTPTTSLLFANGVAVENPEQQRGSLILSESQSPAHPPFDDRKPSRKKTPPLNVSEGSDASDSSAPTPSKGLRLRHKRVPPRLAAIRIQDDMQPNAVPEQREPSPNSLAPEFMDHDLASTPRASTFDINGGQQVSAHSKSPRRVRKISNEGRDVRTRKISSEEGIRETSFEGHRTRDSGAEGDDEGYDDLLSAYESEDGLRKDAPRK